MPRAILTGIHITGCMAQITNTSNSADSTPMTTSTMPSDDEDETTERHQFLTPSSEFNTPLMRTDNGIVSSHTVVNMNNNDNEDDISYDVQPSTTTTTTTTNTPQLNTYSDLSTASSETNLASPLLNQQNQTLPVYTSPTTTEDDQLASSASSTSTSTSSSDGSYIPNFRSFMTLYFTDMLISAFIITPFVNIHWRGAWDLLDLFVLPSDALTSALISLIIGLVLLYSIYLLQNPLQNFYEKYQKKLFGRIMARFSTLFIAFAYINQWRGLWNLLDLTSNQWYHLVIELIISIIFLLAMKSIYNLNSAPFLIGVDTEAYFLMGSKYTISTKRFWQYTFDFLFYELVEAPLIVIAWRGLYNLSDLYIYPDNKSFSMATSFLIGYVLFFILALFQIPFVQCFLKTKHQSIYSFLSNIFHLFAFVSVVQIWRSLWMICEQYINIPNYPHITLWFCYFLAYLVLICGFAACTLNGPGGSKDNYIDNRLDLLFQFDYLAILLKERDNKSQIITATNSINSDSSSVETLMQGDGSHRTDPP